jgi:predicted RNase H-like HicB family nuclease
MKKIERFKMRKTILNFPKELFRILVGNKFSKVISISNKDLKLNYNPHTKKIEVFDNSQYSNKKRGLIASFKIEAVWFREACKKWMSENADSVVSIETSYIPKSKNGGIIRDKEYGIKLINRSNFKVKFITGCCFIDAVIKTITYIWLQLNDMEIKKQESKRKIITSTPLVDNNLEETTKNNTEGKKEMKISDTFISEEAKQLKSLLDFGYEIIIKKNSSYIIEESPKKSFLAYYKDFPEIVADGTSYEDALQKVQNYFYDYLKKCIEENEKDGKSEDLERVLNVIKSDFNIASIHTDENKISKVIKKLFKKNKNNKISKKKLKRKILEILDTTKSLND